MEVCHDIDLVLRQPVCQQAGSNVSAPGSAILRSVEGGSSHLQAAEQQSGRSVSAVRAVLPDPKDVHVDSLYSICRLSQRSSIAHGKGRPGSEFPIDRDPQLQGDAVLRVPPRAKRF